MAPPNPPISIIDCSFDTHFMVQTGLLEDFEVEFAPTTNLNHTHCWGIFRLRVRKRLEINDNSIGYEVCSMSDAHFAISPEGVARVESLRLYDAIPGIYRLALSLVDEQHTDEHILALTAPFRVLSKHRNAGELLLEEWPAFCADVPAHVRASLVANTVCGLSKIANAPNRVQFWVDKARDLVSRGPIQVPANPEPSCERTLWEQLGYTIAADEPNFWLLACSFHLTEARSPISPYYLELGTDSPIDWSHYFVVVTLYSCDADGLLQQVPNPFVGQANCAKLFAFDRDGISTIFGLSLRHEGGAILEMAVTDALTNKVVFVLRTPTFEVGPPALAEFAWLM